MINDNIYIFDCEVFAHDWIVVFKAKFRENPITVIHNSVDEVAEFIEANDPLLAGFNVKHYDRFILTAILKGMSPEEVKAVNDEIIVNGRQGWELAELRDCPVRFSIYDLFDDCQKELSLKAIEGHLGMNIRESTVPFDIDRPLTSNELDEVIRYCIHDVEATDKLDDLRQDYLSNKIKLGAEKGIPLREALYMTNAKLTAAYLDATPPRTPWTDERSYEFPETLNLDYIPTRVKEFFDRIHDESIPSEQLFKESLKIVIGGCPTQLGWGGIHGAILNYREKANPRLIINVDVASYYPHQMVLNGFTSRNIPDPDLYRKTIERRVEAKRSGDKATSNALKLVLNTTYGAMLNRYNDLYDPRMGRSVCISGQLQLLELTQHLIVECKTLTVIQLNTDGLMVSLDPSDLNRFQEIIAEWQERTGFELEEEGIQEIIQKDVNNYIEIPITGTPKIKGGMLVRGIAPAGAFNVNNNAPIVAKALLNYFVDGTSPEETIYYDCRNPHDFQLISKVSSKYTGAFQEIDGEMIPTQRVNRVYATTDSSYGTMYKQNRSSGNLEKVAGMPQHCIVDNENNLTIDIVDHQWYIDQAWDAIYKFKGVDLKKIQKLKTQIMKELGVS